jgi:alpha-1,2-mannosyltransferase
MFLASWLIAIRLFGGLEKHSTDSQGDWLAVRAALDGFSPYTDIRELATTYGVDFEFGYAGEDPDYAPAARTPGALFLLLPISLVEYDRVPVVMFWFNLVVITGIAVFVAATVWRTSPAIAALTPLLIILGRPAIQTFYWGSHSTLLAVATALLVFYLLHERWSTAAGTGLGVATALKLFPGILLVTLVASRRYRLVVWAVGTLLLANLAGVLVLGVSPREAFEALTSVASNAIPLEQNASLIGLFARLGVQETWFTLLLLSLGTLAAWLLGRLARDSSRDLVMATAVCAAIGLLLSPLSWSHYGVLLYPFLAGSLAASTRLPVRYVAGICALLLVVVAPPGLIDTVSWSVALAFSASLTRTLTEPLGTSGA